MLRYKNTVRIDQANLQNIGLQCQIPNVHNAILPKDLRKIS